VFQIENGTFTPLVYTTNGTMSRECQAFYKENGRKDKGPHFSGNECYPDQKINFSLVHSMLQYIRGSRSRITKKKNKRKKAFLFKSKYLFLLFFYFSKKSWKYITQELIPYYV